MGSCRRDLLDHVIVLNERHLKRLLSSYLLYQDSILSETRRAAPSLCGGSVDSRTIVLETKLSFLKPRTRHGSHFQRASLERRRITAIPNRRAYIKEKEILLMGCTAIWRTTASIRGTIREPSLTPEGLDQVNGKIDLVHTTQGTIGVLTRDPARESIGWMSFRH